MIKLAVPNPQGQGRQLNSLTTANVRAARLCLMALGYVGTTEPDTIGSVLYWDVYTPGPMHGAKASRLGSI